MQQEIEKEGSWPRRTEAGELDPRGGTKKEPMHTPHARDKMKGKTGEKIRALKLSPERQQPHIQERKCTPNPSDKGGPREPKNKRGQNLNTLSYLSLHTRTHTTLKQRGPRSKNSLRKKKIRSGRRETKSAVAHSNLLRRIRSLMAVDLPKTPLNLKIAPRKLIQEASPHS